MGFRVSLLAGAAACVAAPVAAALELGFGNTDIEIDTNIAVGAALRVEAPDPALVARANGGQSYSTNGDDATLAFTRGNLVGAVSKIASSVAVDVGGVGLFVRGNYVYNPVLMGQDLFDSADYLPNLGREFGVAELDRKHSDVRDAAGSTGTVQDAYLSMRYKLLGRDVRLRLGRQSVLWSASRLMPNGLKALTAHDYNRLRVPGVDAQDVLVPAAQAWLATDITDDLSVETFYQFEWRPTVLDAAGTFWSTNDYLGAGGTQFNLGFGRAGENADSSTVCVPPPSGGSTCVPFGSTVPRGADREPTDGQQFGATVRSSLPWYPDIGISATYAAYHSRLPLVSGISRNSSTAPVDTARYFAEYPEDIRLAGLGIDFPVPLWNSSVLVEYTHTTDQPLQIDDVELHLAMLGAPSQFNAISGGSLGGKYLQGWRRHSVSQATVAWLGLLGPAFGYDGLTLLAEVGALHVHDLPEESVLRYEGPATFTPGDATEAANRSLPVQREGYATRSSWGYRLLATLTFEGVLDLVRLEPTLRFNHDVGGITPEPLGNFVKGRQEAGLALDMTFAESWTAQLGYTSYFGGGLQNLLGDRDHVDMHLKYAF